MCNCNRVVSNRIPFKIVLVIHGTVKQTRKSRVSACERQYLTSLISFCDQVICHTTVDEEKVVDVADLDFSKVFGSVFS